MARHEHLPIYKAALDMTVHFEMRIAGYLATPTLGTKFREGSRAVLQQILRTNNAVSSVEGSAQSDHFARA